MNSPLSLSLPALLARPLTRLPAAVRHQPLAHLLQWALARPLAEGDFDFLDGQQLALEISDLQITLVLGLANGKLAVSDDDGTAVTRLKGRSAALLRLVTRVDDADTLFFQRELLLSGNTEIGLALKNALDGLEHERLPLPLPQLLKALRAAVRTFNQKRA
ncbi:MAG: SCP2 sterol-binding domain-containing protein [Gammaproteobacteria bacterium]|nr:SCP2 sterol-binding domain-containing protein [Gammaproteobacteria bacterium]